MRKILALISLLLACCLCICTVSLASPVEDAEKFGQLQRATMDQHLDEVLYKIDDTLKITREEIVLQQQALAYTDEQNRALLESDADLSGEAKAETSEALVIPSEEEILNSLIDRLVQMAKAKELGISSNRNTAAAYLDANMEQMDRARFSGTDEEKANAEQAMAMYRAVIKGYGMTEMEYREQIQIPSLIDSLTVELLKQSYLEEHKNSEEAQDTEAMYKEYILKLREEYPNRP